MPTDPFQGAQAMTSYIVNVLQGDTSRADPRYYSLFAIGLTLFVITLVLNLDQPGLRRSLPGGVSVSAVAERAPVPVEWLGADRRLRNSRRKIAARVATILFISATASAGLVLLVLLLRVLFQGWDALGWNLLTENISQTEGGSRRVGPGSTTASSARSGSS